jgi:hypothetical protein
MENMSPVSDLSSITNVAIAAARRISKVNGVELSSKISTIALSAAYCQDAVKTDRRPTEQGYNEP